MLPESHNFVAVLVTRSNNFVSLNQLDRDKLEHASLLQFVTGIATKLQFLGNMLPNIKTCETGWSNFSENLRL